MIEEGRYKARAIEAALGNSNEGNPQVAVCFELLDEGYTGQTITWFGSFSKNRGNGTKTPLERSIETLRVCGWQGDDLSDLSGIDANEVSLVIEHEEYQGKSQAKVKWVNRTGGLALKAPMTPEQAKAFAAKMKGEVLAASRSIPKAPQRNGGGGGAGRHPNAPGDDFGPPAGGDDDIPF